MSRAFSLKGRRAVVTGGSRGIGGAASRLLAEAGADVRIDESEAPADAPNHHPGEGTYRGKYYAAGGLLGTPDAMARFYQWLYGDRLTVTSWEVASSASSRPETAHYGIGSGIDCPCTDDEVLLRGVRVGHATGTGWWRHDRAHRATIVMRFENFSGDYLFAPTFTDESFLAAAWAAVLGQ